MALESPIQYVSDLNPSNPTAPDGLNQGDDHIRGIKLALKNTFPNFSGAALTASQADLDNAVAAVVTDGVSVLADAGAHFKTNTGDGFSNPSAGEVDVKAGGTAVGKFKSDGSFQATGKITAGGVGFAGPGTVPTGMPQVWFEDTLPDASWGDYAWANGQVIANADTRCPNLLSRWTNRFGGNGTTTMGVPDMREAAPVGKSTMGGTTSPGRITNYTATTLGAFIGACTHALIVAELAAHDHPGSTASVTDPGHTHNFQAGFPAGSCPFSGGSPQCSLGNSATASAFTGITVTPTIASQGSGTAHDNVSPGIVCNWVVRLA